MQDKLQVFFSTLIACVLITSLNAAQAKPWRMQKQIKTIDMPIRISAVSQLRLLDPKELNKSCAERGLEEADNGICFGPCAPKEHVDTANATCIPFTCEEKGQHTAQNGNCFQCSYLQGLNTSGNGSCIDPPPPHNTIKTTTFQFNPIANYNRYVLSQELADLDNEGDPIPLHWKLTNPHLLPKTTSIFNKKSDAFTSITDYGRDGLLIQIGVAAGNKYRDRAPSTSNIDAFTHTHNEYDREQDSNTTVIETRVEIDIIPRERKKFGKVTSQFNILVGDKTLTIPAASVVVGTRSKKFPGIDRPDEFKEFEDFTIFDPNGKKIAYFGSLPETMHRDNPNRGDLKDHFDKFSFEYTQNTTGKKREIFQEFKVHELFANCRGIDDCAMHAYGQMMSELAEDHQEDIYDPDHGWLRSLKGKIRDACKAAVKTDIENIHSYSLGSKGKAEKATHRDLLLFRPRVNQTRSSGSLFAEVLNNVTLD